MINRTTFRGCVNSFITCTLAIILKIEKNLVQPQDLKLLLYNDIHISIGYSSFETKAFPCLSLLNKSHNIHNGHYF
jgi:hypothetical protein